MSVNFRERSIGRRCSLPVISLPCFAPDMVSEPLTASFTEMPPNATGLGSRSVPTGSAMRSAPRQPLSLIHISRPSFLFFPENVTAYILYFTFGFLKSQHIKCNLLHFSFLTMPSPNALFYVSISVQGENSSRTIYFPTLIKIARRFFTHGYDPAFPRAAPGRSLCSFDRRAPL